MSQTSYASINPYTEQCLKTFPCATAAQTETLLEAGHGAFLRWRNSSFARRSEILQKTAEHLRAFCMEYAALISLEMGKCLSEGKMEISLCADICDYYAKHSADLLKPQPLTPLNPEDGAPVLHPTPLGIILLIEPWNFPFFQVFRVLVPQLAAGNAVLLKHAPNVPQCAAKMVELLEQAGLPKGVFQNIYLDLSHTERLLQDRRIQGVSLTGSEKAGGSVAALSGKYLKKSSLELGGSDVFIVLEDADLPKAVDWAVKARHANAGQICIAAKRLLVRAEIYDAFLTRYQEQVYALKAGDPADPATTLAPLASAAAKKRLSAQVARAAEQGVNIQTIGAPVPETGYFFQPLLMTGLENKPIRHEEFFGPVTHLYRIASDEEAVALANESRFGLTGSIYTRDIARGQRIAQQIESGGFFLNHPPFSCPNIPFGGIKNSGYGRVLGKEGLLEFMNLKLISQMDIEAPAMV